jgi:hypothetical protein
MRQARKIPYNRTCKYCKEPFNAKTKLSKVCTSCRKTPGGGCKVLIKTSKQICRDIKNRDKSFKRIKWLKQEDVVRLINNIRVSQFRKDLSKDDMTKLSKYTNDVRDMLTKELLRKHKKSLEQLIKSKIDMRKKYV